MSLGAVAGHALSSEISDVPGERCRAEACALLANDTRLDHDTAAIAPHPHGQRRASAPPEAGTTSAVALRSEAGAGMTGSLRGPHDLADEGFRSCALIAVPDASGPDIQTVIACRHGPLSAPLCP
ncbi:hypothetical protein [Acetobacter sp.]|uniref:hypothetical protein n=1 Tax=Acetobacter sp. TaxID=440 RepID=UPI0025BB6FAD|nr:hypothetical protein [Acetobacter sp.]MCH4091853.1 hypothetical protein [Acetobacter sp.]